MGVQRKDMIGKKNKTLNITKQEETKRERLCCAEREAVSKLLTPGGLSLPKVIVFHGKHILKNQTDLELGGEDGKNTNTSGVLGGNLGAKKQEAVTAVNISNRHRGQWVPSKNSPLKITAWGAGVGSLDPLRSDSGLKPLW